MSPWDKNIVVFELEIVVQLLLFHDNNIWIYTLSHTICTTILSVLSICNKNTSNSKGGNLFILLITLVIIVLISDRNWRGLQCSENIQVIFGNLSHSHWWTSWRRSNKKKSNIKYQFIWASLRLYHSKYFNISWHNVGCTIWNIEFHLLHLLKTIMYSIVSACFQISTLNPTQ